MATSPIYTSACAPVTSAEGSSATAADLWFNLVDTKPQQHSQVSNTATNQQYSPAFAPALLESAEAQARAEAAISNNMPRAVLDLQHRMDEHHAQFQHSIASLQGQVSKLLDRVSSSKSSTTTAPTPSVGFTPSSASTAMAESSTSVLSNTAPSYVGPQVLEEMPQQYGFHNLSRQTVRLADGTEHSYYLLPEDYPLERAVPEPVFAVYDDKLHSCSNKSDHVFTSTPEQQSHEEEQQNSAELIKCVGNAPETEQTSACLNYISDAVDYTLEQKQQDDENASVKVQQYLRAPQLNVLLIHERRKEWHPGASAPVHSSNAEPPRELGYVAMLVPKALKLCNQVGTCVQQTSDSRWHMLVIHEEEKEWDPGEKTIMISTLNIDIAGVLQTSAWTTSGIFIVPYVLTATVQFGVSTCVPKQRCHCRVSSSHENHEVQFLWDPGAAAFLMIPLNDGSSNDPIGNEHVGQLVSSTECTDVYKSAMVQSLCATTTVQVTGCMHYIASNGINHVLNTTAVIMQSVVLKTEYQGMRYMWASSLEKGRLVQWDPGIEIILYELWWLSKGTGYVLRYLLAVKFGTHTYTYFGDTAASMCCPPTNLIPQRRNIAALPQFCHSILLSSVVCVWDPEIALVYQQSVQMNYIARNLLSSHNYLWILEMDIIFITFLPP